MSQAKHTREGFDLNSYLLAFRDEDGNGLPEGPHGYKSSFPISKRITCVDGFSLSVQATHGAYCRPRDNIGPWYQVEVGFPSAKPDLIFDYAEDQDNPTQTVYGYVPIGMVQQLIDLHGGPNDEARSVIAKATGGE